MVTIHTSDDILRVLRERPDWKAEVRREILTEELMNLPGRFDSFVETTEQFITEQREQNARFDQFIDEQRQFNSEQRQFNDKVDGFIERTNARFGRMEGDISEMKDTHAVSKTAREARAIAQEMGFQLVRTLEYNDLLEMHLSADTDGIETRELRSFRRADLVIEVTDENDATHYIAMEISYGADNRDTSRAIRNAGFLTRFTGCPAHPAIASIRNDNRIRDVIDSGQVFWYELDDRTPRPGA